MIARRARTKMLALTMMTALATSACLGAPADEEVGDSSQEISTARCSSAKVTTTATVKVMTINLRNESDQWERRFPLIADEEKKMGLERANGWLKQHGDPYTLSVTW